ncbi:hypothetical protein BG011_006127 [Mortierella polycephala]|uniref:Uncharacterized protein n=1 Tax=Mortierella polycephala TaxID=41804 RepID=A0A9P6PW83_9FUNG|nr:hypothetical protein BG011_006127 [Mortierella polycephala]
MDSRESSAESESVVRDSSRSLSPSLLPTLDLEWERLEYERIESERTNSQPSPGPSATQEIVSQDSDGASRTPPPEASLSSSSLAIARKAKKAGNGRRKGKGAEDFDTAANATHEITEQVAQVQSSEYEQEHDQESSQNVSSTPTTERKGKGKKAGNAIGSAKEAGKGRRKSKRAGDVDAAVSATPAIAEQEAREQEQEQDQETTRDGSSTTNKLMSKAPGPRSRRRHYKFRKPLTFATDIEMTMEEWFKNNMDQDEEEAVTHGTHSQPEELTDEALWNLLISRKNTGEGSEFKDIVRFHIKKQLSKPLWQQFPDSRKDAESVRLGLQDHIQVMRYQEKQPHRIVDYIPKWIGGVEKQMREKMRKAQKEVQGILKLVSQDFVEAKKPVISQTRCQWCGVKIPPFSLKRTFRLLEFARIDINGIPLPSLYDFDHEQRRLCLHCVAECGALLKEKRRFQQFYELTAMAQPFGCNNCGIRGGVKFQQAAGLIGMVCQPCGDFKELHGLDRNPPELDKAGLDAIAASLDTSGIHWDKVANNLLANPRFQYTAQGLQYQWLQSVRKPDAPILSAYILLQHNHLTRRSQDWELYTCFARSPAQAALYFARFVALYKKHPMTYLYIRQLENWNIPEPRGDEWEDLSFNLQTFEQLKKQIRGGVSTKETEQESEQEQDQQNDQRQLQQEQGGTRTKKRKRAWSRRVAGVATNGQPLSQRLRTVLANNVSTANFAAYDDRNALNKWKRWMIKYLGQENRHLQNQIQSDRVWDESYLGALREPLSIHMGDKSNIKSTQSMINYLDKEMGLIPGTAGLVPLNPPEPRMKLLQSWDQNSARDVVRKSVRDARRLFMHQWHLWRKELRILKETERPVIHARKALDRAMEAWKDIQEFVEQHGYGPRTKEDCIRTAIDLEVREKNRSLTGDEDVEEYSLPPNLFKLDDENLYRELPLEFRPLKANTLRALAGPRPEFSESEDPRRQFFLEQMQRIDRQKIKNSRPVAVGSGKISCGDEFQGRSVFPTRTKLPHAFDSTRMPSGNHPVHLLPSEYQVHVFQSVLVPEERTANVRLVRTERYKRQGDSIQGGGPVQVPAIINKENMRGFYRESNRTLRYQAALPRVAKRDKYLEPTIVLKTDRSLIESSQTGRSGVEIWEELDLLKVEKQKIAKRSEDLMVIRQKILEHLDMNQDEILEYGKKLYRVTYESRLKDSTVLQGLESKLTESTAVKETNVKKRTRRVPVMQEQLSEEDDSDQDMEHESQLEEEEVEVEEEEPLRRRRKVMLEQTSPPESIDVKGKGRAVDRGSDDEDQALMESLLDTDDDLAGDDSEDDDDDGYRTAQEQDDNPLFMDDDGGIDFSTFGALGQPDLVLEGDDSDHDSPVLAVHPQPGHASESDDNVSKKGEQYRQNHAFDGDEDEVYMLEDEDDDVDDSNWHP